MASGLAGGIVGQGNSRINHEKPTQILLSTFYFPLSTFYFLFSTFYFPLSTFKEVRINRYKQTDRPFKEVMIFRDTQTDKHCIIIYISSSIGQSRPAGGKA